MNSACFTVASVVSSAIIGIGTVALIYQQHNEHQKKKQEREKERSYNRAMMAALFVHVNMLKDDDCKTAVLLLQTQSGNGGRFDVETGDADNDADEPPLMLPAVGEHVVHWNSYEVALAIDSRNEDGCYWLAHGKTRSYRWAYHKNMRDAIVSFATWLSLVAEICGQLPQPSSALQQYVDLLAPDVAKNPVEQRQNALRFIELMFVWRRLSQSFPEVATALACLVIFDDEHIGVCPPLNWWLNTIRANAQVDSVFESVEYGGRYKPVQDSNEPLTSVAATQSMRRLLEYLFNDNQENALPTVPRCAGTRT